MRAVQVGDLSYPVGWFLRNAEHLLDVIFRAFFQPLFVVERGREATDGLAKADVEIVCIVKAGDPILTMTGCWAGASSTIATLWGPSFCVNLIHDSIEVASPWKD